MVRLLESSTTARQQKNTSHHGETLGSYVYNAGPSIRRLSTDTHKEHEGTFAAIPKKDRRWMPNMHLIDQIRNRGQKSQSANGVLLEKFYSDQLNNGKPNYCARNRVTRDPLEDRVRSRKTI